MINGYAQPISRAREVDPKRRLASKARQASVIAATDVQATRADKFVAHHVAEVIRAIGEIDAVGRAGIQDSNPDRRFSEIGAFGTRDR